MFAYINKATLYIFAWILYETQGILIPKGNFFTQILVTVLLLVSFYHFFIVNTHYKISPFFKGLNALLIMFSVYGLFLIIGGYDPNDYVIKVPSFSYLKGIYISIMPIYSFYYFSKENFLTEKMLPFLIICFLCFVTIQFLQHQRDLLIEAMLIKSSREEFTNNFGYSFLSLIPACVYFYKRPVLQYVALGYCFVFLLMGMKRGAVLIGAICLVWFLWKNLQNESMKKKITVLFLSIMLCFAGYTFFQKKITESEYFQKRVELTLEGNSSGRDKLFKEHANYFWNEASPLQFVFGSGANATLRVSFNYAHNDWLEIAVNQGVLGLLIYLFYWFAFAKSILCSTSPQSRLALQLLFIIYFLKTFFSMSYGDMSVPATFILGFSLAQEKKNEQICNCN